MKLNSKQKGALIVALLLTLSALITWIGFGAEIFTKTQVLVEKKDKILGRTYKEWKDQFVLGLDYILGFIFTVWLVCGSIIYYYKKH
ncbi:hypothetical protein ABRY23_02965 [Melioribacteraceae bacterium 4301-Me]|uniref:hypothetical protein n=1 Tax=Pyranulibacter aquaticus TaxID=3163344 RepID=UPI0035962E5D